MSNPGAAAYPTPSVNHHVALRTGDIERGVAFYSAVFGAAPTGPVRVIEDAGIAAVFGLDEARIKVVHLRLPSGTIELFEFVDPAPPTAPELRATARLLHFGIEVEDVEVMAAGVEANGGHRLHSGVRRLGQIEIIHATDPDGNPFELLNAPMEAVSAAVDPDAARGR